LCVVGGDRGPRAGLVVGDEAEQLLAPRPAARVDVAGSGLGLLDLHVGVEGNAEQVVGRVAGYDGLVSRAPVVRQPDLVHLAAGDNQRGHPVGDQYPRLDCRTGRDDGGPAVGLEAALGGQCGRDLTEHLRLQLGEVRKPAAHPAGGVVLGEPVGGEHVRIHVRPWRAGARRAEVVSPREGDSRGTLLLRVERVGDRGLLRLVVRGQRPVNHALGREQPALAVRLHDERVVAGEGGRAAEIWVGAAARSAVEHEVGHVVADPAALLLVPPDPFLPFAPWLAVQVGRRPVVQDPPVGRPRPAPLRLAPSRAAVGHPVGRVVNAAGVDPGVDPAPRGRRSVGAQLGVRRERLTSLRSGAVVAVDLR
jgi:hypothetical protein